MCALSPRSCSASSSLLGGQADCIPSVSASSNSKFREDPGKYTSSSPNQVVGRLLREEVPSWSLDLTIHDRIDTMKLSNSEASNACNAFSQ